MTSITCTALVEKAFHTAEADARIAIASAPGYTCVIEPAALARLFETDPAAAWLTLSRLNEAQLTIQAIDYTMWLNETSGRDVSWTQVLETFERRIAKLSR